MRGAPDLHELVFRSAMRAPNAPAVISGWRAISFAELHQRVRRATTVVSSLAPRGGRIAVIGDNHPVWIDAYYAIPAAGRVLVCLNHRLAPPELAEILERSGASAVVGSTSELERLRDDLAGVTTVTFDEWESMISAASEADPDPASPDETAWIIYTSGTTAKPKGAMLSHAGLLAACRASVAARPLASDEAYVFPFPLCHSAGYNVPYVHAFARPIVLMPRFESRAFIETVAGASATSCSLAATMLASLLDHLDDAGEDRLALVDQLRSLRSIWYGAAPMPPALLRRARAVLGVDFSQGYGMTELSGNAVFLDADAHRRGLEGDERLLSAAGRPAPGVELRIADDGEILVRAEQVMVGYFDDPVNTAVALDNGWLHTGDVGRIDDGWLYVTDRKKDVIITGGENVSSREVEDTLHGLLGVREVAVVGVPDARWGENVCAVVVGPPGEDLNAGALVTAAREKLAGFKVPRHIVVVEELPKNATGKIVKAEVRRWLADHLDRLGPRL